MTSPSPSPILPFPELVDNSAISSFKKCATDWYYGTLRSISRKGGNIHLHFGGAYAAGLEAGRKAFYDDGLSEDDALAIALDTATRFWGDFEPPEDATKTYERLEVAQCLGILAAHSDDRDRSYRRT